MYLLNPYLANHTSLNLDNAWVALQTISANIEWQIVCINDDLEPVHPLRYEVDTKIGRNEDAADIELDTIQCLIRLLEDVIGEGARHVNQASEFGRASVALS